MKKHRQKMCLKKLFSIWANICSLSEKIMNAVKKVFSFIAKSYIKICKLFDSEWTKYKEATVFTSLWLYLFLAVGFVLPLIQRKEYFNDVKMVVAIEVVLGLAFIVFLSCTIMYHKKSAFHWIFAFMMLPRYVVFFDMGAEWNKQYATMYLGIVAIFIISIGSWRSAKDINKNGGMYDTIILSTGLFSLVMGYILRVQEHSKHLIVFGIALIYLYAIARALLWIFFSKEQAKVSLYKMILYTVFYIAIIFAVPFFLQYVGIKEQIIEDIILPIYASVIGGILTLAGVAWTIKRTEQKSKEDEKRKARPLFAIIDDMSLKVKEASCNIKQFYLYEDDIFSAPAFVCNLQNTDQSVFFVNKISIDKVFYYPDTSFLISKDEKFQIMVMKQSNTKEERKTFKVYVTDLNYEEHVYDIIANDGIYEKITEVTNE